MTPSADQSRLELQIGGAAFPVLGLSGREELNQVFTFHVSVLADSWAAVGHRLGQTASLTMTAPDGYQRRVNGIVTGIDGEQDLPDGRSIVRITVQSCLALLKHRTDSRLIVFETLPAVIRQTLNRHNIPDSRLDFQLARQYPVKHTTLQAQEDDLTFIRRLAGRQGMLLWSEGVDGDEIIPLADTTNRCPMLAREELTYTPNAGMETTDGPVKVGMLAIADRARRVPAQHWVHDVHELAPEHPTLVGRATDGQRPSGGKETCTVTFGSGAENEEEAKHQALIRAQRAATIRHTVEIRTHAADLRIGALIRLDTTGYSTTLSGDYLITAVEHKARQYAGFGLGGEDDCPYTNTVTLIRRENPWRPELPEVPELPQVFSARVESRDPIPELDGAGRYRYRQYPDSNNAPHAEASAPTRRLQPYAGPSDGMPFGWHLPLHDDNEVLVGCLNNDPDRPMLVGTLSNPAHGSVVTAENAAQNLLYTSSGNQLAMDDWRDKSAITFCTFAGHTMLHFNADVAGHRINLETGLGQMECYAKKTHATESGDTLTETVGNDRIQQIENRQHTTTNTKEIHHQAKTDGQVTAADNIQMESGQNLELTAGQDLHLDITEATRIRVHEQDAIIHVDSGSLTIQADGAITIEGDGKGTILFEQNGGGFKMAPNGDITIFGDEISLEADEINFYGPVSKEITEPDGAPVATMLSPLETAPIAELEAVSDNDSLIRPIYPVRYAYANFFKDKLSAPAAPPPLKDMLHKTDADQTQGYVMRLLRPGWIYIREEDGPDGGYFHIFKYEHIERDGDLQEKYTKHLFKNGINAQGGLKEDTSGGGFGYPFVFVRQEVTEISIAYSEHEWHPDVIDKMNGDAAERAAAMQRMTLAGLDFATIEATSANFKALVEDYRDHQDRLLRIKDKDVDPNDKDIALDVLTTQASYELDPDQIADEIRRNTNRGEVARIVGLFDPVGRQREIAEIHAKLVLTEAQEHSANLYPFTIGRIVEQLRSCENEDVRKIVNKSINWQEHDEHWRKMEKTYQAFKNRKAQYVELYTAFMLGKDGLGGQVGSLDTYFKKFFCKKPDETSVNAELEKLCIVCADIYAGILSSEPGQNAVVKIVSELEAPGNAYYGAFEMFRQIVTTPQQGFQWDKITDMAVDRVFQSLGVLWGQMVAKAIDGTELAWKTANKISFNACRYAAKNIIPAAFEVCGIKKVNGKAVFTQDELARVLAAHLEEGIKNYPGGHTNQALKKAVNKLKRGQRLFDWGERFKRGPLSKMKQIFLDTYTPTSPNRYKFALPQGSGKFAGLMFDNSATGLSIYFNVKTILDVTRQTQYDNTNPLQQGSQVYGMFQITQAISSLTFDTLAASRTAVGGMQAVAQKSSSAWARALVPRLQGQSRYLATLAGGRIITRVVVAANFAGFVVAVWDGCRAVQAGNRGEATGNFVMAAGLGLLVGHALLWGGSTTAATSGVLASTIAGIPLALIVLAVGFILLGVGVLITWIYSKTDFQILLENCFWGNGGKYLLWDKEKDRPKIADRLRTSQRIGTNEKVAFSYQVELQEFMNYLYMPQLELDRGGSFWFGAWGGERTYTYRLTLPNFQPGVSDIEFGLYAFSAFAEPSGQIEQELDEGATQALCQAMERALQSGDNIVYKNGSAIITIELELNQRANLIWVYRPQPGTVVPARFLTQDGLRTPIIGMLNERPL